MRRVNGEPPVFRHSHCLLHNQILPPKRPLVLLKLRAPTLSRTSPQLSSIHRVANHARTVNAFQGDLGCPSEPRLASWGWGLVSPGIERLVVFTWLLPLHPLSSPSYPYNENADPAIERVSLYVYNPHSSVMGSLMQHIPGFTPRHAEYVAMRNPAAHCEPSTYLPSPNRTQQLTTH